MSKDTWDFDARFNMPLSQLKQLIQSHINVHPHLGITISGGDPFFQNELGELLRFCKQDLHIEDILVYTGFTLEELKKIKQSFVHEALQYIDVLIDGKYMHELNDNLPLRGSSNQVIHFFNPLLKSKYEPILTGKRTFKMAITGNQFTIYGLVPTSFKQEMNSKGKQLGLQFDFSSFDHGDEED